MSISLANATESKVFRYVITETSGPTSFDPLEADNTNNLPVSRMLFATPLEVSKDNRLTSRVLDAFSYDETKHLIQWEVKKGLTFEDGTFIAADDVAFAVARMAYTRPNFPVIEHIEGVKAWASSKKPLGHLPEGIKVAGQKVTIQLDQDVAHPLFRFCLELFAIIPKHCVDLGKNVLNCKQPPASGPYALRDPSNFLFVKRDKSEALPEQIRFEYVKPEDFEKKKKTFDDATVIAGNEMSFSLEEMTLFKNFTLKYLPAARFTTLLLNPESAIFAKKKCRRFFAKAFREAYAEINGKARPMEASLFTKILPGYLSLEDLEKGSPLSKEDLEVCKATFKGAEITWGDLTSGKRSPFNNALKSAVEKVGAKLKAPKLAPTRSEITEFFSTGQISVLSGNSGFWALDPAGDINMLLTPNLHAALKFVSSDTELQKLLKALGDGKSFEKVNFRIFEEANFNVYTHLRRFYASPNEKLLAELPVAITSPAPWQVFGAK